MTYYKEKLYKEIFENVICLKFSNNIENSKRSTMLYYKFSRYG